MIRGAVSNNDLVLWWQCQWLLQVQFTFVFEEILEGGGNLVSSLARWKECPLFNPKDLLKRSSNVLFNGVRLMMLTCLAFPN
jgi:hypothetical protein